MLFSNKTYLYQTSYQQNTSLDLNFAGEQKVQNAQNQQSIRLIWALSLASVIVYINLYIMQGMLPTVADHFQISSSHASYVLSVTTFTLAFSVLLFAVLTDRIGRRKPIVISLILLAISNLFLLFIDKFDSLLWLRFIQGILLAAIPASAMAYFKDKLNAHFLLKAGAIYIAANSIGGIVGRLLGGIISQHLNWLQSMEILILVTAIGVTSVIYLLPKEQIKRLDIANEVNKKSLVSKIKEDVAGFIYHLKDKQLRLIFFMGALAFMIMVNQFSFIQLRIMSAPFELNRFQATLIFLCYLSGTLLSLLSAKAICKMGHTQLFLLGFFAITLGTLLTLGHNLIFIFSGFFITAGGFFLIHSCANSFVSQRAQIHRAKATSLYLCCYYLGASLGGPFLMPFWHAANWNGVVLGSGILLILLLLVQYAFGKEHGEISLVK